MEEVNIAFAGAGVQMDEDHGPAYKELEGEGVRMAAIADPNLQRAATMADKFGIPGVYGSLEEMLTAEPDLHAVVLAVPNGLHGRLAMHALTHGLHVFVEKPMATSLATATEMAELALSEGLVLWPSQLYRYMAVLPITTVMARDKLGPVERVRAEWFRSNGIPERATFIQKELAGGGVGMDLAPHLLSVVLPALPYPAPMRVSARTWKTRGRRRFGLDFEVEDRLQGVVDFPDGVHLTIDVGWEVDMRDEERVVVAFEGSEGALEVPLLTGQPHTAGFDPGRHVPKPVLHKDLATSTALTHLEWPPALWECITLQTRDFVDSVRAHMHGNTESPAVRGAEESLLLGVRAMQIVDALYESAALGGRQVELRPRRG